MVVLHPEMNLIIVEGGTHSMSSYKKLMLQRVKWAGELDATEQYQPHYFHGRHEPLRRSRIGCWW